MAAIAFPDTRTAAAKLAPVVADLLREEHPDAADALRRYAEEMDLYRAQMDASQELREALAFADELRWEAFEHFDAAQVHYDEYCRLLDAIDARAA